MTDTPMKVEINCTTGEVIERPFTAEEMAQRELDVAAHVVNEEQRAAKEQAFAALKESARAKLVTGQPLTEEEAATIVL